jgi:hypothetical protein
MQAGQYLTIDKLSFLYTLIYLLLIEKNNIVAIAETATITAGTIIFFKKAFSGKTDLRNA